MWSIAIYRGLSPFNLEPAPPVLTKADITDVPAAFVADPFMLRRDHTWYMFFEVMNLETRLGEIGLATSNDGLNWTYDRIVLREPFHLSYPHVFVWQNEHYMIPEMIGADAVCLYKALDFPYNWARFVELVKGAHADPSLLRFDDRWWLFTCSPPYQHATLKLYFADELLGPWTEHPKSPLIRNDMSRARPAGRILKFDNRLFRLAQDCAPRYGSSVRAFEIKNLTTNDYAEVELRIPILKASGSGWNANGMHHIDAHQQANGYWLACVDGCQ
jgi:hypothetical protein